MNTFIFTLQIYCTTEQAFVNTVNTFLKFKDEINITVQVADCFLLIFEILQFIKCFFIKVVMSE